MANDIQPLPNAPNRRVALAGLAGLALAAAAGPGRTPDDPLSGHWQGVADLPGDRMAFSLDFSRTASGASIGSIDIADSGVFRLGLLDVAVDGNRVRFAMPFGGQAIPFEGEIAGDRLAGRLQLGTESAPFSLVRRWDASPPYVEEPVTIVNGDVRLNGALLMPAGPGPHPAMLFQHSGRPDTRQPWLFWADHFARNGIAGLVYDNRGADGPRDTPWVDFSDVASDALAALHFLRRTPGVDRHRVGLFAVSQGGWIAPMVAARDSSLAFVALVSPPGLSQAPTVLYEARREMEASGLAPAQVTAGVAAKQRFERMLLEGASDDALDAFRASVLDQPWFRYVGLMPRGHWHRGWWRRNGAQDPGRWWPRVQAPLLALHGDRDVELPVPESLAALQAAYRAGGRRTLTTRIFPGADHSLRIRRGVRPVRAPEVMATLTAWVRAHARLRPVSRRTR